jgi:hypothetical protein
VINAETGKVDFQQRSEKSFLNIRNDQPVVDCAYAYQKENQEETGDVEENCCQEKGTDEEGG